jgi:transcriptional regulator with XRE-family HTH domain
LEFGKYLKHCRISNDLTQDELVVELSIFDDIFHNLDARTLSRWENLNTTPSAKKQVSIVKYFKQFSDHLFPCIDFLKISEKGIDQKYLKSFIENSKDHIINFPANIYDIEDLKIINISETDRKDYFLEISYTIFNGLTNGYYKIKLEHFKEWSSFDNNRFFIAESNGQFLGMLYLCNLKLDVYNAIIEFKKHVSSININDFASIDEKGGLLFISFFAYNEIISNLLFTKYYSYLLANHNNIKYIGSIPVLKGGQKVLKSIHLKETNIEHKELKSYSATLEEALLNEDVFKIIF